MIPLGTLAASGVRAGVPVPVPFPDIEGAAFEVVRAASILDMQPQSLVFFDEPFAADTGQFTIDTDTAPGTLVVTGGQAVISHGSGAHTSFILTGDDLDMPNAFVSILVQARGVDTPQYNIIGAGIARDASNFIYARYDRNNGGASIQYNNNGVSGYLAPVSSLGLAPPFRIGLAFVGNDASLWLDTGNGWFLGASADLSAFNLQTMDLTGWRPSILAASTSNTNWTIRDFHASRVGSANMRDQTLVTLEDGTPYIEGRKLYFTASGTYAYAAVYTFDLDTYKVEQVGSMMVRRDGGVRADLVPHIIRYPDGTCRVTISTWHNGMAGPLYVLHKLCPFDVLHGGHVLEDMEILDLPMTTHAYGAYDSFLVKTGGTWFCAYCLVNSFPARNFYVALASSTDLENWTPVGQDVVRTGYEGTKIAKAGSDYYVLAGDQNSMIAYDLEMNYLGPLDAYVRGGDNTQPHPSAFYFDNQWQMLSFDNSLYRGIHYSWGKLIYQRTGAEDPMVATVSLLPMTGPNNSTEFPDTQGLSWSAVWTARISTALGEPAAYFDGSSGVLTRDVMPLHLGNADFLIECDLYLPADVTSDSAIYSAWSSVGGGLECFFGVRPGRRLFFLFTLNGNYDAGRDYQSPTNAITLGVFQRVSVERRGGTVIGKVNGVTVFSGALTGSSFSSLLPRCWGQSSNGANRISAYMRNCRIVVGRHG